jgi:predicted RNA methylase
LNPPDILTGRIGMVENKRKGTTKNRGQKHALDKFYTSPTIAQQCIDAVPDLVSYTVIIEPSAGNGSFSSYLKKQHNNVLAFDIHPEAEDILEQDWFKFHKERNMNEKVLVIGNPPFGQQNSLAVQFINHASLFADTIAFILPKSFMKTSVQERLNQHLKLVLETELPNNSFLLENKKKHVPSIFQVWEYDENYTRIKTKPVELLTLKFVKKTENPDFYIQRIGGNAGRAGVDWEHRSDQSNYFLTIEDKTKLVKTVEKINQLSFPSRHQTVGPRSISRTELTTVIHSNYPEM